MENIIKRSWLKDIREAAKLTQEQVADAAGITRAHYTNIETGVRGDKLPVDTAKAIANALGFNWQRFYE